MTFRKSKTAAFSLIEVTLALGIAAFCLVAVLGLMPVGVQTNRNATSQTAATSILSNVIADMRATPTSATTSIQYGIEFGAGKTLYFDGSGQFTISLGADSRYRLVVSFPTSPADLSYADLRVTWPASVIPANASGSVEMFAAFDRN